MPEKKITKTIDEPDDGRGCAIWLALFLIFTGVWYQIGFGAGALIFGVLLLILGILSGYGKK